MHETFPLLINDTSIALLCHDLDDENSYGNHFILTFRNKSDMCKYVVSRFDENLMEKPLSNKEKSELMDKYVLNII